MTDHTPERQWWSGMFATREQSSSAPGFLAEMLPAKASGSTRLVCAALYLYLALRGLQIADPDEDYERDLLLVECLELSPALAEAVSRWDAMERE